MKTKMIISFLALLLTTIYGQAATVIVLTTS